MYRITVAIIISTILFYSCGTDHNKAHYSNTITITDINKLEAEIFNTEITTPDIAKAKHLAELYIEYAELHPDDSISPDFLFKASDINMNVNSPKLTISLFNKVLTRYPDYVNVPTVMFLKGFVYEDQLKDYDNARKCYMEFLDKYPNSDFADDATVSLKNLGKSPEELIKEFETNDGGN